MSTLDRATEAVTAFAERYLRQCATPGAAIALTDAHATRATACLGFCDLEAGLRVTPQTAFGIGSVSKTLTAIAALQLRDAGLLDLDSPVDRYLPWLRLGAGRPVPTCRQLLTHTAGLPSGGLGTGGSRFELVRLADLPFLGPVPGWSYSNVGYQILGYVLEEVSSQPHAELVASGILDPLGMRGTFAPARRAAPGDRLAAGYQRTDLRPACPQEPSWRLSRFSYAGNESALAATSGDLATLVRLLLGSGAAGQARVLARRSAEEMITGQVPVRPGSQYGYGVDEVLPGESLPFLGHYRSYNPWLSNFHIVGRAGQLALLLPSGHEQPLFPGPAGIFGVGRPAGPDYLKFDSPVDGMSLRCSYSGVDYFRAPWSARRLAAVP